MVLWLWTCQTDIWHMQKIPLKVDCKTATVVIKDVGMYRAPHHCDVDRFGIMRVRHLAELQARAEERPSEENDT